MSLRKMQSVKVGDIVALAMTHSPRVGPGIKRTFNDTWGIVIDIPIHQADPGFKPCACKVMWESGAIGVQLASDLEVISD